MNPIVYAIPVFMASILLEIVIARWKRVPTYNIPDALTSLHFGTLSQTIGAFVKVLGFGLYVAVYERWHAMELPTDAWWVWVAALVVYDFIYYWIHRFGHEVNCLWAAHQVHHSSEYYNLSTALRQSSTGAVVGWPFYLVMAVAGVPPLVFGVVALIDLLYQYWVHTELVRKLGWFDRVFVSPSNHRVHHGQNDYCIDRNYGGILVIWDRLFGTFAEERAEEPVVYGVRKRFHSLNPVWGNFVQYRELFQASRAAPNWRAALAVWFGPPQGWNEPVPHADFTGFQRYQPEVPRQIRPVILLQAGVLMAATVYYILMAASLNWTGRLLAGGFILLASAVIGAQLEGRWRASAAASAGTRTPSPTTNGDTP
jgi:sterol desaturase/sphingolipid hydroxylase (fatty acid hydroxylase superfamily)